MYGGADRLHTFPLLFSRSIPKAFPLSQGLQERADQLHHSWHLANNGRAEQATLSCTWDTPEGPHWLCHAVRRWRSRCLCQACEAELVALCGGWKITGFGPICRRVKCAANNRHSYGIRHGAKCISRSWVTYGYGR